MSGVFAPFFIFAEVTASVAIFPSVTALFEIFAAVTGFFSKWLPEETAEIIKEIESTHPLDILWDNIQLQYAAIIRAQKLMYVQDQDDKTTEVISEMRGMESDSTSWEVQQAWDKHANFLNAQSRAMKTLESMIKNYEELLNKNWDIANEEQKLRVDKLKQEIASDKQTDEAVRIIDDI
jgi:uncharacterized protein YjcR